MGPNPKLSAAPMVGRFSEIGSLYKSGGICLRNHDWTDLAVNSHSHWLEFLLKRSS